MKLSIILQIVAVELQINGIKIMNIALILSKVPLYRKFSWVVIFFILLKYIISNSFKNCITSIIVIIGIITIYLYLNSSVVDKKYKIFYIIFFTILTIICGIICLKK
jgi:hypothetical protein